MSADAIAAANDRLSAAVAAGDAAVAAACYTPDGKFMVPNMEPVAGREAIQGFFQGAFDQGVTGLDLETDELELFGDTATEVGRWTLRAGDQQLDRGKFVVLWKNVGGEWLLHRDIINTSLPAPA